MAFMPAFDGFTRRSITPECFGLSALKNAVPPDGRGRFQQRVPVSAVILFAIAASSADTSSAGRRRSRFSAKSASISLFARWQGGCGHWRGPRQRLKVLRKMFSLSGQLIALGVIVATVLLQLTPTVLPSAKRRRSRSISLLILNVAINRATFSLDFQSSRSGWAKSPTSTHCLNWLSGERLVILGPS